MDELRGGYEVIAQALGVDQTVLRSVVEEWARDRSKAPMTMAEFEERLVDAMSIARRLNNTNLWEQVIMESLDPTDIPATVPTLGVPRFVVHEGGKKDNE
jgi:hypothetical protein